MRSIAALFVVAIAVFGQEDPRGALYDRCGSQIDWLTDGVELPDCESLGRRATPAITPAAELLKTARAKAVEKKLLIFWYVPRQHGSHMNRATILESYARTALFSDPDVVKAVGRSFIPLRTVLTRELAAEFSLAKFDFIEPGFLFLKPGGTVIHRIDRIRTFNAAWFLDVLAKVSAKCPEFAAPAAPEPTTDYGRAIQARLRRDGKSALKFLETAKEKEAAVEKARLLMHQGKFEDARAAFEKAAEEKSDRQDEAIYWLGLMEKITGRSDKCKARWERVAKDFPQSAWGWKSAACLIAREDTLPMGAPLHHFEDVEWPPEDAWKGLPTTTRWERTEAELPDVARRAFRWLLARQDVNGAWTDSRYVYCDTPKILPNVFVAVTALACAALWEWRDLDPAAADAAIARGEKYLMDEKSVARGQNEDCYADAYRLTYLARRQETRPDGEKAAAKKKMEEIAAALGRRQVRQGFWAHEYPNPFCTAAVIHGLAEAKKAGAEFDAALIARPADGLKRLRSVDGRFPYDAGRQASTAKNSSARNPLCEAALLEAGQSTKEAVAKALDGYFEHMPRQEAVRVCDFHADQELGGFFFFHGFFHATEAARMLDAAVAEQYFAKFRAHILRIGEFDGSFLDSHELGKAYGTAMALLSIRNCRREF